MTNNARRSPAILGSLLFLVLAPGTVAGLVPWWITGWQVRAPLLAFWPFRPAGVVLTATGLGVLLDAVRRFAVEGLGTPAPVAPPKYLVVSGLYRHTRNPMYLAVLAVVLGQALYFGDTALLIYTGALFGCFHTFVVLYEEPKLRATFSAGYSLYIANVPRWIPRLHGWEHEPTGRSGDNCTKDCR
jgi:protein-S-isoprenylcysteine O-methyltransferase Ste14